MHHHTSTGARRSGARRLAAVTAGIALSISGLSISPVASADDLPAATTYYVNCSATAQGAGTATSPWRSLASVSDHGPFAPGDKILLQRGTTCHGRVRATGSGAPGAPILLGATGKGARPRIVGGGTADQTGAVELRDVSYWTVQDLDISNWGGGRNPAVYRSGVLVWNSGVGRLRGITIQRNTVHHVSSNPAGSGRNRDFGGISVLTAGATGDGFDGVVASHNTISDVGRTGIMISNREYPNGSDTGVIIDHNSVGNARGDGIVLLGSRKGRMSYNTISGAANFWPCPQCRRISPATANAALWTAQSTDVRIDHNETYGTRALGGDGEGIDVDASAVRTVVEYNYSHDNQGGGILFCGSVGAIARFNIFENNAKSAIAFIGSVPAKNTSIYNNTIYSARYTKASVVRTFNGHHGTNVRFFNNIVFSYYSGVYAWPTKVWSRDNTFVGAYGKGEPHGLGSGHRDPRLRHPGSGRTGFRTLGGYRPVRPYAVGHGIGLPKDVSTDFFGQRIDPRRPPRGAAAR